MTSGLLSGLNGEAARVSRVRSHGCSSKRMLVVFLNLEDQLKRKFQIYYCSSICINYGSSQSDSCYTLRPKR